MRQVQDAHVKIKIFHGLVQTVANAQLQTKYYNRMVSALLVHHQRHTIQHLIHANA
jgi:hypothetical protein